jgi:hypothetical protein
MLIDQKELCKTAPEPMGGMASGKPCVSLALGILVGGQGNHDRSIVRPWHHLLLTDPVEVGGYPVLPFWLSVLIVWT